MLQVCQVWRILTGIKINQKYSLGAPRHIITTGEFVCGETMEFCRCILIETFNFTRLNFIVHFCDSHITFGIWGFLLFQCDVCNENMDDVSRNIFNHKRHVVLCWPQNIQNVKTFPISTNCKVWNFLERKFLEWWMMHQSLYALYKMKNMRYCPPAGTWNTTF